jgi:hypothetical protein
MQEYGGFQLKEKKLRRKSKWEFSRTAALITGCRPTKANQ